MDRSAPPPFDQGLFLTHLNKGREAYEARRFPEAERELEEAYLLRPRDQQVLNLLGLTYFKQERLDKAEEIYRKLVAESPEAPTLYYNLGLIGFKLDRLDEAESAFLKAIELAGENPKIRFYLGSIYERQRRFQDAIYQYRQAGAHIMVRRVEDKLGTKAAGAAPGPAAPPIAPADPATLRPSAPASPPPNAPPAPARTAPTLPPSATPPFGAGPPAATGATLPGTPADELLAQAEARATLRRGPHSDDTARVRPDDVRRALAAAAGRSDQTQPPERVRPVSQPLLTADAPARAEADTARFRHTDAGEAPHETFRALENSLVEVEVAERVFIRPGTLYSYSGAFTFWVKERRQGGHPALAIATGKGRLMLRDRDRDVTFVRVENDALTVEPEHLLACEASLQPRFMSVGGGPRADFLVLEGRGLVALSVAGKPLSLTVSPDLPVCVPAASVITWNGTLEAALVDDPQLYEAVGATGGPAGSWIRFQGDGRVLVEQHQA